MTSHTRQAATDLALVIIAVEDQPAAARFWTSFTRWTRTVDNSGGYTEYLAPGGTRFGIYARAPFAANFRGNPDDIAAGPIHATEAYLTVADAGAATSEALNFGATLLDPAVPRPWGDTVAYLKTPGGFVLALAAPSTQPTDSTNAPRT